MRPKPAQCELCVAMGCNEPHGRHLPVGIPVKQMKEVTRMGHAEWESEEQFEERMEQWICEACIEMTEVMETAILQTHLTS